MQTTCNGVCGEVRFAGEGYCASCFHGQYGMWVLCACKKLGLSLCVAQLSHPLCALWLCQLSWAHLHILTPCCASDVSAGNLPISTLPTPLSLFVPLICLYPSHTPLTSLTWTMRRLPPLSVIFLFLCRPSSPPWTAPAWLPLPSMGRWCLDRRRHSSSPAS